MPATNSARRRSSSGAVSASSLTPPPPRSWTAADRVLRVEGVDPHRRRLVSSSSCSGPSLVAAAGPGSAVPGSAGQPAPRAPYYKHQTHAKALRRSVVDRPGVRHRQRRPPCRIKQPNVPRLARDRWSHAHYSMAIRAAWRFRRARVHAAAQQHRHPPAGRVSNLPPRVQATLRPPAERSPREFPRHAALRLHRTRLAALPDASGLGGVPCQRPPASWVTSCSSVLPLRPRGRDHDLRPAGPPATATPSDASPVRSSQPVREHLPPVEARRARPFSRSRRLDSVSAKSREAQRPLR